MSAERYSRRSFLQGRAAAGSLVGDERDAVTSPDGSADGLAHWRFDDGSGKPHMTPHGADRGALLVSVRRRAMACEWEVQLAAARNDDSMEHVFAALDLVESLEDQMTVYRNDSEVIRINRAAAEGPVEVEARLYEVFQFAAELYRETRGALDITSGPLSETWGFSRRRGRVPGDDEIVAAMQHVGMNDVVCDESAHTIAFARPGLSLNLNSIGKGYALDRMAERLAEGFVDDYLLHGGRSSVLARGDHPGRPGEGWTIGLRHPIRTAEPLAEFVLQNQALSTSGSATQFFRRRGRRYGHILDPRTGRPAEGIYSATVIAPTAAEADALSTAFYVMGPSEVGAFCASRPEIAALLICPAEREADVRLHAFGLGDDQWQQLAEY